MLFALLFCLFTSAILQPGWQKKRSQCNPPSLPPTPTHPVPINSCAGSINCHLTRNSNYERSFAARLKHIDLTEAGEAQTRGEILCCLGFKLFICQPPGLSRDVSGMLSFHPCSQRWTLKSLNGPCVHTDLTRTLERERRMTTAGLWGCRAGQDGVRVLT